MLALQMVLIIGARTGSWCGLKINGVRKDLVVVADNLIEGKPAIVVHHPSRNPDWSTTKAKARVALDSLGVCPFIGVLSASSTTSMVIIFLAIRICCADPGGNWN